MLVLNVPMFILLIQLYFLPVFKFCTRFKYTLLKIKLVTIMQEYQISFLEARIKSF
jgi:hypothetical protein